MRGTDGLTLLEERLGAGVLRRQPTADGIPTAYLPADRLLAALRCLKTEADPAYEMLFDLTAVDERVRRARPAGEPEASFTAVYHLLSLARNAHLRLKVAFDGDRPALPTVTGIWPSANWYERELWDMFGLPIEGHPQLARILMPGSWRGHPLRKEHPARATDMEPYTLTDGKLAEEQAELRFDPRRHGWPAGDDTLDRMVLNFGPHHPGTHGLLRIVLGLEGELVRNVYTDIGFHHRGAEKMAERQTYHTFIPYTDRVDYLAGVQNNFPYVMAVEQLSGIEVPLRAEYIRVLTGELFRIVSHLVYFGTLLADLGSQSPVFLTFTDRERAFYLVEAFCGGRMHPQWFRIGGVAQDLPRGWKKLVDDFLGYLPGRLDDYERMLMANSIFRRRTRDVGTVRLEQAIEWGFTGPNLRACGLDYDLRRRRPYSVYDRFEFDVPTAADGDCYARTAVRLAEMRQSLRIMRQAADGMPDGPYASASPRSMPPRKPDSMQDIETLIHHFLAVSWGHPVPPGEACGLAETPRGITGYHVVSDGGTQPYRVRIRTPSFPHIQALPLFLDRAMISDVTAVLGAIDFVMADVDR